MDEKKKKNPPVKPEPALSCKNIVAVIAIIVSLMFLGSILVGLILIAIQFTRPVYYGESKVILTCEYLHLPSDSALCANSSTSDQRNLRITLPMEYPIGQTSISELVEGWDVEFEFIPESCDKPEIVITDTDTCPMMNNCGDYACYAYLPVDRITVRVDSQGIVTGYGIVSTK